MSVNSFDTKGLQGIIQMMLDAAREREVARQWLADNHENMAPREALRVAMELGKTWGNGPDMMLVQLQTCLSEPDFELMAMLLKPARVLVSSVLVQGNPHMKRVENGVRVYAHVCEPLLLAARLAETKGCAVNVVRTY